MASWCEVMNCIALPQVSMQLYSAREKEELNHVISIMIDYNLNYVQERTQEGTYAYNLDPWVSETMAWMQYGFVSCITLDMETLAHILCECEALASLRHTYLGSFFLEPEDIKSMSLGAVCSYGRDTRLLWFWYGAQRARLKGLGASGPRGPIPTCNSNTLDIIHFYSFYDVLGIDSFSNGLLRLGPWRWKQNMLLKYCQIFLNWGYMNPHGEIPVICG